VAYRRDFTKVNDIIIGDDLAFHFEIFQSDLVATFDSTLGQDVYVSGTPEDVGAWTFRWELRVKDTATGVPILSKTTAGGITITGTYDAVHSANTQRVVVTIADTETYSDAGAVLIPPKTYVYSLKRDDPGSEKTVVYGKFVLQEKPARL
jgi:hypothetical protein